MFHRSRRNLARWFTWSMGSILVSFASAVYCIEVQDQLTSFDQALLDKIQVMAASVEYRYHRGHWELNLEHVPLLGSNSLPLDSNLVYARWYNERGQLVQFVGAFPSEQLEEQPTFQTIRLSEEGSELLRQVTFPVTHHQVLIGYLQVAISLSPVQEAIAQMRLFLSVGVPVALGAITLTGWYLGGRAMSPIRNAYDHLQRFTANASHELRSPLSAILSNAQVGLILPTGDGQIQRDRLSQIVKTAKEMSQLVDQLLFLSRSTEYLSPEVLKQFDFGVWLENLAADYAPKLEAQQLDLQTQFPLMPVLICADPDLLRQAIVNLLDNACKYTPAGGQVCLRLSTSVRFATLEIADNGIGIPAGDLPHIFERFYRVDSARNPETGGFGLGLSIVDQIVKVHRGQIRVSSTVNRGTTFTLEFPLL
ncbi:MAG: ATP-binding protein [Desertifilum sp.]|nr:ATP-binding protein [Desertifilum sp.]